MRRAGMPVAAARTKVSQPDETDPCHTETVDRLDLKRQGNQRSQRVSANSKINKNPAIDHTRENRELKH